MVQAEGNVNVVAGAKTPSGRRVRPSGALLAILSLVWYAVCREVSERAATGLLGRAAGGAFVPFLGALFLLFLSAIGFAALDLLRGERWTLRESLALPARTTALREWGIGAAIGWGAAVSAIVPVALGGALYLKVGRDDRALLVAVLSLLTLAAGTLATEAIFRGYALRRLSETTGPAWAAVLLSCLYAAVAGFAYHSFAALLVGFLLGLLLTMAWRRAHALWLPWGLHFGWSAALGALFGLPVEGRSDISTLIQSQARGGDLLTGSGYGPMAAPWTAVVLLLAMIVLAKVTHDLAWRYTHPTIVAAGYAVNVDPPPAHASMEQSPPPPPLVQILPSAPAGGSRDGVPLK